eukprot:Sspe_Gene.88161::Locus_60242_Transcript_1_1_Confidence_1.000_Length_623::g.88161::m.88161
MSTPDSAHALQTIIDRKQRETEELLELEKRRNEAAALGEARAQENLRRVLSERKERRAKREQTRSDRLHQLHEAQQQKERNETARRVEREAVAECIKMETKKVVEYYSQQREKRRAATAQRRHQREEEALNEWRNLKQRSDTKVKDYMEVFTQHRQTHREHHPFNGQPARHLRRGRVRRPEPAPMFY